MFILFFSYLLLSREANNSSFLNKNPHNNKIIGPKKCIESDKIENIENFCVQYPYNESSIIKENISLSNEEVESYDSISERIIDESFQRDDNRNEFLINTIKEYIFSKSFEKAVYWETYHKNPFCYLTEITKIKSNKNIEDDIFYFLRNFKCFVYALGNIYEKSNYWDQYLKNESKGLEAEFKRIIRKYEYKSVKN